MRRLILLVGLGLALPASLAAKDYSARQFDVSLRTLDDGSIQVTETLRMTFEGGPFTFVSRKIPLSRTDGIDVLGASMDGRVMRRGTGAGQFEVRMNGSSVAIRWHFTATSDSTHDFRLSYVARGVVERTPGGTLLKWQPLPGEHSYPIASSRIVVNGVATDRDPSVRTRRVAGTTSTRSEDGWIIEARGIGSNGWLSFAVPTTLTAVNAPKWQQREERQRALAPRLVQFAVLAAVLGLTVVLLIWRQYPPAPIVDQVPGSDGPPAARPPAVAAAILSGGRSSNAHAPGTLFDLASRGAITVTEAERRWKPVRRFTLTRGRAAALAPHETALLEVMFRNDQVVDLSRAASRLKRRGRSFHRAVNEEMRRSGLLDELRATVQRRLFIAAVALMIVSLVTIVPIIIYDLGVWGIAIPLAVTLAAVTALVLAVTRAQLSDEGFRERERWRAFRKHLQQSLDRVDAPTAADWEATFVRYLPYLAAMGFGVRLSSQLKKHGGGVALPAWFRTVSGNGAPGAFAAFIGSTAHSTGSGAAGSGAAGGGSSSAG